jgi:hypothetical protein
VRHHSLDPAEFALLHALAAGRTVAEALAEASPLLGNEPEPASLLHGWFQRWAANGFFRAALLPNSK